MEDFRVGASAATGGLHAHSGWKAWRCVRIGDSESRIASILYERPGLPLGSDLNSPEALSPGQTDTAGADALSRVRIVLVEPSHPGNIGSVARAMKTMGLSDLRLVAPRSADALSHPEAIALATGAVDILKAAKIHNELDKALADCPWSAALTARVRELAPLELAPERAAQTALLRARQSEAVALVFGNERYGLDNESIMRCQACCTIPTSAEYSSLNLAMAVQIMAYECRLAAGVARPASTEAGAPRATHAEREQLYAHLEAALVELQFLDPVHHTKLMHRLRRLFARADLEHDEVNILRGICTAIQENRP